MSSKYMMQGNVQSGIPSLVQQAPRESFSVPKAVLGAQDGKIRSSSFKNLGDQ